MADQLPKFQGPKYRGPFQWLSPPDTANSGTMINFTGSRRVFSRASAGHKRKSLVKIGEVTPPKRPSILGPLELGEPIDHSGTPPSPPVIYGAIFRPPPSNSDPPLLPPLGLATGATQPPPDLTLSRHPARATARRLPMCGA